MFVQILIRFWARLGSILVSYILVRLKLGQVTKLLVDLAEVRYDVYVETDKKNLDEPEV